MTSQFSPKVSEILAYSREEATRLASRSVGPEHLLLGIIRDRKSNVCDVLRRMAINTDIIKAELEDRVREDNYSQPLITTELVLNDKASNILKLAVLEARVQHTQTVDVEHLLLAMLHDKSDNGAKIVLESNNITYDDALAYLHKTSKPNDGIGLSDDEFEDEMDDNTVDNKNQNKDRMATATKKPAGKTPVLDNFSTDLTQAALDGKLDPVVGRTAEIARMMEILCRRKKNNPILIGEPGVGKSAIVEGLAQLIAHHRTSPILFGKRVVSLDMTAMVAGTKYRGQFEERIKTLLRELEQNPDIIVFIDEIHTMIGAGSTPGSMDAANIMKPALARGTIQCIGATTIDEYRKSIEKDGALERRFQKVLVEPTSESETLDILRNIKDRYEEHHHVSYTDEALSACVKLTGRYVNDRHFPDKAIDALDEVGAKIHLLHAEVPVEIRDKEKEIEQMKAKKQAAVKNQNFELAASFRDRQTELEAELAEMNRKWTSGDGATRITVTDADVANVVAMMSGVPVQKIAEAEGSQLRHMAQELKSRIVAQDAAIDKVVKSIQRNRVGLKDPNHPIGAFMFLGPTGVGKTYLAKQLAIMMFGREDALIRIDMSEYSESFNTSRLVGAPPGYVGYEEGGQLTEAVRRKPYAVVLFDEIEKAHPDVFNVLLQVLDDGRITDSQGRTVDFKNTILIMTSNIGAHHLLEGIQEDGSIEESARKAVMDELRMHFRPEFLNRLDETILFKPLTRQDIGHIIHLIIDELNERLADREVSISVTPQAEALIAEEGYDPIYGARPLKRYVQKHVETLAARLILEDRVAARDTILVDTDENGRLTAVVETK